MRWLTLALLLLLAGPASATDWHTNPNCSGGGQSGSVTIGGPYGGGKTQDFYWCPTDGGDLDQILVVSSYAACTWDPDTTGTGGTATVAVYRAADAAGSTSLNDASVITGSPLTGGADTAHANLNNGTYLFVASAAATNGRLWCRGRD